VPAANGLPTGLGWFLAASFFNGIVIELGRKIRRKEDEEHGVETYSVLWGKNRALLYWLMSLVMTMMCGWRAACLTGFSEIFLPSLGVAWLGCGIVAVRFFSSNQSGKWIEAASALWTLILYISLGILPLCLTFLKN
jgi:4-hydroxybenzoate polyprenyltransferase